MEITKTHQFLDRKLLCFLVLISLIFISSFQDIDATSLSQRYGNNYSTHQTSNTGTVYGPAPNNGVSTTGYTIPVGATITSVGVKIAATGGPTAFSVSSGVSYAQHQTGNTGFVIVPAATGSVQPFVLPAGSIIDHVGIHIFATGGGNIRVKIYDSVTGLPNNLLGESGTVAIGSTGWVYIPVSATAPADGKIFATYEFDNTNTDVYTLNPPSSVTYGRVAHVFGAGPNPFGTESFPNNLDYPVIVNYTSPQPHIRVKVYDSVSGNPKHLLGESGSLPISGTGWQNFTVNAVTNTTQTYVAYELDNSNTDIYFKNPDFAIPIQTHVYGSGPNPMSPSFTANIGYTSLVNYNTLTQLTLVPTSGNVGSTVTATGANFTTATVSLSSSPQTGTPVNFFGNIYLKQFTGLPLGGKIIKVGEDISNNGTSQVTNTAGLTGSTTTASGSLICAQETGLPTDGLGVVTSANFNIVSGTGNVRVKIYNDTSNSPSNLLGESGSIAVSTTGTISLPVTVTIPTNGIVWACVEADTSAINFNSGTFATTQLHVRSGAHTYGSGPNPFGSASTINGFLSGITYHDTSTPHFRFKFYTDSSNSPNTLINETTQLAVIGNGLMNFTTSAIIPSNGIIWVGLETDSSSLSIEGKNFQTTQLNVRGTHTYGTGPSTFGANNAINAFWEQVSYINNPVTLKWDGSTLTTNPTTVQADQNGAFSATFIVPSSTAGSHTVNASDTGGLWAIATYSVNAQYSVSLKPLLHDGITPITSGKLIVTQNGATIGTGNTNSTGWATVSNISGGNYNFTIMDDKNFAVYKELNTNVASNIVKNVSTNDYPFDCISPFTGYQSDFIIRINDTDGHHITSMTTPTCPNQNQLKFSVTFTANGQSSTSYSSSMITTAGTQVYAANPSSLNVSNTIVPTTFTQGNNIVSNSFSIANGLTTITKNFIMNLTTTQSTNAGAGSSGQNYFTTNSTCFAGVFDPKTNSCVFGLVNITAPPVIITTNPNTQQNGGVEVDCSGNGYITITSANLGSNPLGIALGQLPVNIQCGQPTPTTCPAGTTLTNGVCVAPLTCPIGSQTQNGICTGQLTCQAGTTFQNGQCIAPTTCADGSMPVNGQCNNIVPITLPPTPSPCDITNPLSCITSTTQSQDVVVTGVTPDGKPVSVTTTVTKVLNPELNNVSLVIILLIIAAIIAGIIYRYLTRKKKPKGRKVKNYSGNGNKIDKFNKKVKNEV